MNMAVLFFSILKKYTHLDRSISSAFGIVIIEKQIITDINYLRFKSQMQIFNEYLN